MRHDDNRGDVQRDGGNVNVDNNPSGIGKPIDVDDVNSPKRAVERQLRRSSKEGNDLLAYICLMSM